MGVNRAYVSVSADDEVETHVCKQCLQRIRDLSPAWRYADRLKYRLLDRVGGLVMVQPWVIRP